MLLPLQLPLYPRDHSPRPMHVDQTRADTTQVANEGHIGQHELDEYQLQPCDVLQAHLSISAAALTRAHGVTAQLDMRMLTECSRTVPA